MAEDTKKDLNKLFAAIYAVQPIAEFIRPDFETAVRTAVNAGYQGKPEQEQVLSAETTKALRGKLPYLHIPQIEAVVEAQTAKFFSKSA